MAHPNPNCKPSCFGCKASSVSIAPSSMGTRSNARAYKEQEKQKAKDLPAYKRLRQEGLQPKTTQNAAFIENHASSRYEVETNQIFQDQRRIDERVAEVNLVMTESKAAV